MMNENRWPAFPPVFYARYAVEQLSPEQIDELLASGWFRNDINLYCAAVKFMGDAWRSSLMLRIPLEGFTWKKRLHKLLKRNNRMLSVSIQPFEHAAEKDALWRVFKSSVHNWVLIPSLSRHLFKDRPASNFNTWEISVRLGGKLVAFSVFDKGNTSIASLEAAYDPAFGKFSLGIYTMMLEIEYAKALGMSFYYPGFIPRDVPMFDYKLRPGQLEFFRLKEKNWIGWEGLIEGDWLLEGTMGRLEALGQHCRTAGFVSQVGYGFFQYQPMGQVSPEGYNVFLVVVSPFSTNPDKNFLLAWDPLVERFLLFSALIVQPVQAGAKFPLEHALHLLKIPIYEWLGSMTTETEVVDSLLQLAQRSS